MLRTPWFGSGTRRRHWTVIALLGWLGITGCHIDELVKNTEPDSSDVDPDPPDSSGDPVVQASRLVFEVEPAGVTAGETMRPTVKVAAQDDSGETVATFTETVTLEIASGPEDGSLSGTLERQPVDGVAVFDDVAIARAGSAYVLAANAGTLDPAVSDPFAVGPASPVAVEALSGDRQVDSVAATLPDPYVVTVVDAYGNPVPSVTVEWTVASGGGSIAPERTDTDAQGHASAIHTLGVVAGDHTVVAAAAGLPATAMTFVSRATPGQPSFIEVTVQPSNTGSGSVISPPVVIRVKDQFGNVATQLDEPVTAGLAPLTGTPLASLSGTLSRNPVFGSVTFDDLAIDLPGLGYRLRFTTNDLSRDSSPFNVSIR